MRKDIFLPLLALAGGGAGFGLRLWQLTGAFDPETRLFQRNAPATLMLIGLMAALAVLVLLMLRSASGPKDYPAAFFCPGAGYMTLMTAGSFLLLGAAVLGLPELMQQVALWRVKAVLTFPLMLGVMVVLCIPAALACLLLGKGNYRGSLPRAYPMLATLPAYVLLPWLVSVYQTYSREPEELIFAFEILGGICALLGFYGAACFAFGRPCPRRCLFTSLMGVALLLTALADRPSLVFAAMSLACVLLLLAQSYALLRNTLGPAWPAEPSSEEE